MLADHRREFEAVGFGHIDVDKDDRDFALEQMLERLARPVRGDQVRVEVPQNCFISQQLGWLVVDQKNIDPVFRHRPRLTGAASCGEPTTIARC
jgi:hypothetical protein